MKCGVVSLDFLMWSRDTCEWSIYGIDVIVGGS
jgi:hypothetical protein